MKNDTEKEMQRLREQAAAFDKVGTRGDYAMILGQMAELLHFQGDKEEALRILNEEAFPAGKASDNDSVLANLYCLRARIHMYHSHIDEKGALDPSKIGTAKPLDFEIMQGVIDDLSHSFNLSVKASNDAGIAAAGGTLGQLMMQAPSQRTRALQILKQAMNAAKKIGEKEYAKHLREVRRELWEQITNSPN